MRILPYAAAATFLASCASDHSITEGADGAAEWQRRLANAIPVGTLADSARATMERNGFTCAYGADIAAHVWCDKSSGRQPVSRRWQAMLMLDSGRVATVKGSTGLVGP